MIINSQPSLRFPEFQGAWVEQRLDDIAEFFKGKGISKSDVDPKGDIKCIRYGELYTHYGEVILDIKSSTNVDAKTVFFSEKNDVIIPASGETAIDIATASCVKDKGIALGGDINVIRAKVDGTFLAYYLNNTRKHDVARFSQGISVIHLYATQLKLLKIRTPNNDKEAKKLGLFFSTIDLKIKKLKDKHALLVQYKKGVMQKLFSQEIRFKDENGNDFPDWTKSNLGEYIVEYKKRSKEENEHEVLTSSRTGLMKQSDYYTAGRITERSNKGFNVIPENHITFRSRSDDRKFFFNLNNLGMTGIISTYYPVFKMQNGHNVFFIELTRFHKNVFGKYAVGTSQVVLSMTEFLKIKLNFPSDEEQEKISQFSNELDKKITLVAQQAEQTQIFKKGLLQQMFV